MNHIGAMESTKSAIQGKQGRKKKLDASTDTNKKKSKLYCSVNSK